MNFFSEYTALYFFSALLQANAAIIAIVGVFFIFRIQTYQSSINSIKNYLFTDKFKNFQKTIIDFYNFDRISQKEYLNKEIGKTSDLYYPFKESINIFDKMNRIKNSIQKPTILLSIGILINALGLLFSNFLHNFAFLIELIILLIFLIYEIVLIFVVVKSIFKALELKNTEKKNERETTKQIKLDSRSGRE